MWPVNCAAAVIFNCMISRRLFKILSDVTKKTAIGASYRCGLPDF